MNDDNSEEVLARAASQVDPSIAYRLRQQALLISFSQDALRTRDLNVLLHRATELCAEGLASRFSKVLKYLPSEDRFLVKAGVGWRAGIVGHASLGADCESPAGYAFKTGEPVISHHLERETRFRTPELLVEHGIRRAINVLIVLGDSEQAYGVLEVDSPDVGEFDRDDAAFLQGFANFLGIAVQRQKTDDMLVEAHELQTVLTQEMSHRVKNSLVLVASFLRLQSRNASSDVKAALEDAGARVQTVAEVHEQLWRSADVRKVDLKPFLTDLCQKLEKTAPSYQLRCTAESIVVTADRAIALGLLINELITNALKYAYPDGAGVIEISARTAGRDLVLEVSDHGVGLPETLAGEQGNGRLGFSMIAILTRQVHGVLRTEANDPGLRFVLTAPLDRLTDTAQENMAQNDTNRPHLSGAAKAEAAIQFTSSGA